MTKKREQQLKEQRRRERKAEKQKQQRVRGLVITTIAVVAVIVGGFFIYQAASNDEGNGETAGGSANAVDFSYGEEPAMGEKDAPLKVVEFGDYQCPACKAFNEVYFPDIKKNYIDTGKVQFYFMNFAFLGEGSKKAAVAAEAVYNQSEEAFWKYHDALYENQGKEGSGYVTLEFLLDLAKEHTPNIDIEQLKKDIENETYANEVAGDREKAVNSGVTSTPTFFINGEMVEGHYAELGDAIEEALKEANQ